MKILIAIDGTESSKLALDFLHEFPIGSESELTIMTVVGVKTILPNIDSDLDDSQKDALIKARNLLTEDAKNLVNSEADHFRKYKFSVRTEVALGHPVEEITRLAKELDTDLIVVGSHGAGQVKRFLLGSVSDQVLQYSHCSVLIVRPDRTSDTDDSVRHEHPLSVLLAVDDSEDSKIAVEFCASLPLKQADKVTALTVLPLVTSFRQDIRQQLGWLWKMKKRLAEERLNWVENTINWNTPNIATLLKKSDDVCHEVLDSADELDSDLIVMGIKSESTVKSFLLGSIARRIAHHAPCSVLAVRAKKV